MDPPPPYTILSSAASAVSPKVIISIHEMRESQKMHNEEIISSRYSSLKKFVVNGLKNAINHNIQSIIFDVPKDCLPGNIYLEMMKKDPDFDGYKIEINHQLKFIISW